MLRFRMSSNEQNVNDSIDETELGLWQFQFPRSEPVDQFMWEGTGVKTSQKNWTGHPDQIIETGTATALIIGSKSLFS